MKLLRLAVDALFLCRPVLWVPVWGFSLLGALRARAGNHGLLSCADVAVLGWTLVFSCAVGAVYVLNQIADVRADRANRGFALMAHGGIGPRLAWASAACLALASLALPLLAGRMVVAALSLAALTIGVLYSLPPVRLSGRPVFDFVSNAVGYGLVAFAAGWHLAGGALGADMFRNAGPYVLLMAGGSISSTIPDVNGDLRDAKRTTAVLLGSRGAHGLALLCIAVAGACGFALGDHLALWCAAGALPLYVVCLFAYRPALQEASYKAGGGLCMAVVGAYWPLFALLCVAVLAATWAYFRLRFHVNYPSLTPAAYAR